MKPTNPYSAGGMVTDPEMFFGRDEELKRIRDRLNQWISNAAGQKIEPPLFVTTETLLWEQLPVTPPHLIPTLCVGMRWGVRRINTMNLNLAHKPNLDLAASVEDDLARLEAAAEAKDETAFLRARQDGHNLCLAN